MYVYIYSEYCFCQFKSSERVGIQMKLNNIFAVFSFLICFIAVAGETKKDQLQASSPVAVLPGIMNSSFQESWEIKLKWTKKKSTCQGKPGCAYASDDTQLDHSRECCQCSCCLCFECLEQSVQRS